MLSFENLHKSIFLEWDKSTTVLLFSVSEKMEILDSSNGFREYKTKFTNIADLITYTHKTEFISKFHQCVKEKSTLSFVTNFSYDLNDVEDIPHSFTLILHYEKEGEIIVLAEPHCPLTHNEAKNYFSMVNDYSFLSRKSKKLEYTLNEKIKTIQHISYTDELTQLYNRKSYNEKIEELLSLNKRYQTPFSMMMYDIDDFKSVNDTYGHKAGDKVLIEMSKFVKSHIRDSDYLFRIGGEEFVILFAETNLEEAKVVSEKICKEVAGFQLIEGKKITISIGLTEAKDTDTDDSIFKRVDSLLYYSKLNGKNRVSVAIVGDMMYAYYFDEERNTLYEKINGTFMNIEVFRKTLMDEEFMKKYLSCESIITDFRGLDMNFEHFENKVTQLFLGYKRQFDSKMINTKRVATYIYKFDNVNAVKPFRDLQESYGIETQNFQTIDEISEFIGFDTQKYFNMTEKELTVHS